MDRCQSGNMDLNYTLDLVDPKDIYITRTPHPTATECTFFSSMHGACFRTDKSTRKASKISRLKLHQVSSPTTVK